MHHSHTFNPTKLEQIVESLMSFTKKVSNMKEEDAGFRQAKKRVVNDM